MTAKYYETVAKYLDHELNKKRETFLIKAETCSDAEYILMQYLSSFRDLEVISVKLTRVTETHTADTENRYDGDQWKWYMCKVSEITQVETTGIMPILKPKKTPYYYACHAESVDAVSLVLENLFVKSVGDWEVNSISESKIVELLDKEMAEEQVESKESDDK